MLSALLELRLPSDIQRRAARCPTPRGAASWRERLDETGPSVALSRESRARRGLDERTERAHAGGPPGGVRDATVRARRSLCVARAAPGGGGASGGTKNKKSLSENG